MQLSFKEVTKYFHKVLLGIAAAINVEIFMDNSWVLCKFKVCKFKFPSKKFTMFLLTVDGISVTSGTQECHMG